MREIIARLGLCIAAAGATIVVMDTQYIHPIWSYGMALCCLGALVFLINELEHL